MAGGFGFGGFSGTGPGGHLGDKNYGGEKLKIDKKIMLRLSKYVIPYWHLFLISLILVLLVSASGLARPYLIKVAIDSYISKAVNNLIPQGLAIEKIGQLGIVFAGLIAFEFLMRYTQMYILQLTGKKIIVNLRNEIFKHIQRLPIAYFDKNSVGRILTRATNDTEALNEMFTNVVVGFLQDIFLMAGIVVIMFKLDVKLTLISFTVLPIIAVVTVYFRKKAREIFGEIRTKLSAINSFLSEHLSGMKIIQAFNMQDKKQTQFEKLNKEYYDANYRQISLFGIFRPFMDVISLFALALLLWYGGKNIIGGTVQVGTLFAFINYINRFFQPIMELTEKYNIFQGAIVSSERIFSLLDEKEETGLENREDNTSANEFERLTGEIEFKNVWFAYIDENWVLKDVSFKIFAGQSAAFVGATGAGKTSIINLICGFYENQKGEILIDGIDIRKMSKNRLRRNIGLVLQDIFLFSGNIETNIKLFDESIDFDKVKQAAEYVNADSFIERLPEAYKSIVSEKGNTFSMGERQLISFARAIVRNPKILVMDEATSSIDTETENLVQEALAKIMKDRTTIAIAHRLSTIQKADIIIVIHKGEIAELGNHKELIGQKGMYYKLYELQYVD